MKSYSQSGQDAWCDLILGGKRNGTFLEIGANHPIEISNSYAFESQLGWYGVLVERDQHCIDLCRKLRSSPVIGEDALTVDWPRVMDLVLFYSKESAVDYLSLDCDENTLPILRRLLASTAVRFRVLTVETDFYIRGAEVRDAIDGLLTEHGYDIICKNVQASDGSIYESWCVDPKLVDMKAAERFRSDSLKWSEILERA